MSLKRLLILVSIVAVVLAVAQQFRPQTRPPLAPQAAIESSVIYDDEFTADPTRNSIPRQIFTDPRGNLYVLGAAEDVMGKWWIVRRKKPSDREWATADRFQLELGQPAEPIKGYYDDTLWPAIFIEGEAQFKPGEIHFINRSSRDNGTSWRTVWHEKDTRLTTHDSPLAAFIPNAGQFHAGANTGPTGKPTWSVHLISRNSGEPVELDQFRPKDFTESAARWIAVDGAERIWVGGDAIQEDGTLWWAIRVSEDYGKSWRTLLLSKVTEGTKMIQGVLTPGALWILSTRRGTQGGQLWLTSRLSLD